MPYSFPFIIYLSGTGTRLTTIALRITMLAAAFLNYPNNRVEERETLLFHILTFVTLLFSGIREYCKDYSPAESLIFYK
jgi:hypothetical protein